MWRTHKNRVDRGLGSTYKEHGAHESLRQGHEFNIPNFHWSLDLLINGAKGDAYYDNPFIRWHESYEKYSSHLSDLDDVPLYQTQDFERIKKFKAKNKDVVGTARAIPLEDNDEKWEYYDLQGESLYSHPPDPNTITVDHGLDEENIWCFPKNLYNQEVVKNPYFNAYSTAALWSHAPQWGQKMSQPHYYKPEKLEKFHRHWVHRLGLEAIKARQAAECPVPTEQDKVRMEAELNQYIKDCYDFENQKKLDDVYVTDHVPAAPQYLTKTEEEDDDAADYERQLAEYNQAQIQKVATHEGKYEKGSLMQKMFDPFAGAAKAEDGAIEYTLSEKELSGLKLGDEAHLRELYNRFNADGEVWDCDPEDEEAWNNVLVEELDNEKSPFKVEEFRSVLDKELGVFQKEDKYDFVKDLKEAYSESLSTPMEKQIFKTIPAHAFWDIKKPQHQAGSYKRENRYNPFRGREYNDFFDMRDSEEYLSESAHHRNLNNSVSSHAQY